MMSSSAVAGGDAAAASSLEDDHVNSFTGERPPSAPRRMAMSAAGKRPLQ